MSTDPYRALPEQHRTAQVRSGEHAAAATAVRFDRPLVEQPGWADPRIGRQIAEVSRSARAQALAEGYAAGWAQGRRAATEREVVEIAERAAREEATRRALTTRAQGMLAALAQAARTLGEQVVPAWDDLLDVLVDGALGVAAAGFARELAALDGEVLEAARVALRLLPASEVVALHVHPGDLELFGPDGERVEATFEGLRLVPDDTVAPGTVVARTPLQSLPVDLRAAFAAAEEVLRP